MCSHLPGRYRYLKRHAHSLSVYYSRVRNRARALVYTHILLTQSVHDGLNDTWCLEFEPQSQPNYRVCKLQAGAVAAAQAENGSMPVQSREPLHRAIWRERKPRSKLEGVEPTMASLRSCRQTWPRTRCLPHRDIYHLSGSRGAIKSLRWPHVRGTWRRGEGERCAGADGQVQCRRTQCNLRAISLQQPWSKGAQVLG